MRTEDNSGRRGIKASPTSEDFILEFDSPDSEFQRGFECGEIWACLTDDVEQVHAVVSASNAEMILRMAEATGYKFSGQPLSQDQVETLQLGPGEWMIVVMRSENEQTI